MNPRSHIGFRLAILVFALLLGLQCIWLLLAELSRPDLNGLPTDAQAAAAALEQRRDATWAARISSIRGDLWAESAYTYADSLWTRPAADADQTKSLEQARASLYHALDDAPYQAGAWLLLAGLASHYRWQLYRSRPEFAGGSRPSDKPRASAHDGLSHRQSRKFCGRVHQESIRMAGLEN